MLKNQETGNGLPNATQPSNQSKFFRIYRFNNLTSQGLIHIKPATNINPKTSNIIPTVEPKKPQTRRTQYQKQHS